MTGGDQPLRVVLDTNLLVSSFVSRRGAPYLLMQRWYEGAFLAIVSPELLSEYRSVLAQSDYVTIHLPLNASTRHLIDASSLEKMRPETMLINTSRGAVIDEAALVSALSEGRLAAAGLDVFEREPLAADHPLRSLESVTLTPHVAAWSEESIEMLRVEMCETIADWITTGWTPNVVNPEVRATLRSATSPTG